MVCDLLFLQCNFENASDEGLAVETFMNTKGTKLFQKQKRIKEISFPANGYAFSTGKSLFLSVLIIAAAPSGKNSSLRSVTICVSACRPLWNREILCCIYNCILS
jgi:hypothetical protein